MVEFCRTVKPMGQTSGKEYVSLDLSSWASRTLVKRQRQRTPNHRPTQPRAAGAPQYPCATRHPKPVIFPLQYPQ